MTTVDQLRQRYLDFFKSKAHKIFPSDSLVPSDDPSLLFTGAGMNQFKPYFLGLKRDIRRAASSQKCLRTADLDRVGKTAYHHSFFEMLGNFSFGDYFKEEAIAWGWEFVTKELKLPEAKLWVSVYQEDDEAFKLWKTKIGLPETKIVRMGPEDNFWPANAPKDGPNGPCGPCSEIYVGPTPGKGVEIWNLVFTQFDRQPDGSLKPLPQKNIDTGMGLERCASVVQNVESNFDIDSFAGIRHGLKGLLKPKSDNRAAENAVMDHIRAVIFSIGDGALPSNEGRGYVIRKIIRLASDHMDKAGVVTPGSLHKLVPTVVHVMGQAYPELAQREKTIVSIIENEEKAFLDIQRVQLPKLKDELTKIITKTPEASVPEVLGKIAFEYYDTYGVPLEMIQAASAATIQRNIPQEIFDRLMARQKNRSREQSKIAGEIFKMDNTLTLIEGLAGTDFLGYDSLAAEGTLTRILQGEKERKDLQAGQEGLLFFDRTPFYAESGGQVGDTGVIAGNGVEAAVLDTQWIEKCAAHKVRVDAGNLQTGKTYRLAVDGDRRADIMKNHTATHILHSALRKVLGEHVKQSGSLVAPDRLRFDFTHFKALSADELSKVEALVNEQIAKNTVLNKKVMSKQTAVEQGAIAFFGEKYGDQVRVVSIGEFSKELCGGTHLNHTGEIGVFKITSEGSIQAGVRRLEAVTGRGALELARVSRAELDAIAADFGSADGQALKQRLKAVTELKTRLINRAAQDVRRSAAERLMKAPAIGGVKLFEWRLPEATTELFTLTYEHLKTMNTPFVALWQCETAEKVTFVVAASKELGQKGLNAGKIVKEIAAAVEGNGGGRPDFAVGGGKNLSKTAEAVQLGVHMIKEQLNAIHGGNR